MRIGGTDLLLTGHTKLDTDTMNNNNDDNDVVVCDQQDEESDYTQFQGRPLRTVKKVILALGG